MTDAGPVLLDNTVLSNLALVGRSDLIRRLWPSGACSTGEVLAEYEAGAAAGLVPADAWSGLPLVSLTAEEGRFASALPPRLGAGERACLAVAYHRNGLLASDDQDARRMARRYGVPTTGTVGVLVLGVLRGMLSRDTANSLLRQMTDLGFRAPVADIELLLE